MKTTKIAGQIFSRSDHLMTELQQLQNQLNHNRCLLKHKIDKLFAGSRGSHLMAKKVDKQQAV